MPEAKIFWKHLDCVQVFEELPSGHLAIDVFEFPKSGWKSPHQQQGKVLGKATTPLVTQKEFEIAVSNPAAVSGCTSTEAKPYCLADPTGDYVATLRPLALRPLHTYTLRPLEP